MIAPFLVLFAAMWTLTVMTRRHELVVMRMAGASLWQLLLPLFAVAFLFGVMTVGMINPLAAASERQYQHYEQKILKREQHMISLLNRGLWMRQSQNDGGTFILHARRVTLPSWDLEQVMVLFFDGRNQLINRLDASSGRLTDGAWVFGAGTMTDQTGTRATGVDLRLPTTMTAQELQESFMTPDSLSVWSMPRFIRILQATGFPALPLQVEFAGLLLLPLLCVALVMVAAAVSIRPVRQGGQGMLLVAGIGVGFAVFFFDHFLQALGASGQLPVWLAATAPVGLVWAAGTMAILHIEDR